MRRDCTIVLAVILGVIGLLLTALGAIILGSGFFGLFLLKERLTR